jgi:hypothetical protein
MLNKKKFFFLIKSFFLIAEMSTPPSPRTRLSTLSSHSSTSNGQFYGNNSPLKSQSFNQNHALMSIMQQPYLHHHTSIPYNTEKLSNDNQRIFNE